MFENTEKTIEKFIIITSVADKFVFPVCEKGILLLLLISSKWLYVIPYLN